MVKYEEDEEQRKPKTKYKYKRMCGGRDERAKQQIVPQTWSAFGCVCGNWQQQQNEMHFSKSFTTRTEMSAKHLTNDMMVSDDLEIIIIDINDSRERRRELHRVATHGHCSSSNVRACKMELTKRLVETRTRKIKLNRETTDANGNKRIV